MPSFIIIFERHWDIKSKETLIQLFPLFSEPGDWTLTCEGSDLVGYNAHLQRVNTAIEFADARKTEAYECLQARNINTNGLSDLDFSELDKLMLNYVSTKHHQLFAEQIKDLPGKLLFRQLIEESKRLNMGLLGIDIGTEKYDSMLSDSVLTENMFFNRVVSLDKFEADRNETISNNLLKLYQEGKNVIFICGASHADKILSQLNKKIGENNLIYYFICSPKLYDKNFNEIKFIIDNNPTLTLNTRYLNNTAEVTQFANDLLEEINFKNPPSVQQTVSIKKVYPAFKYSLDQAIKDEIKNIENSTKGIVSIPYKNWK